MKIVIELTKQQSGDYHRRMWCASVIIALANIIRKTGVPPLHDYNTLQVMFTYLCLESPQRKYIVESMDEFLR